MRNRIFKTKIVNTILIFLCCFYYNNYYVDGFYVPGVAPQDYKKDDIVDVKVNQLKIRQISCNLTLFCVIIMKGC